MPDSENSPDIETGADTLLDFLEEKSRYSVSQISDDLGIPEDRVEKWAKALEDSGLVSIDYSAIKGMVLEYDSDKSIEELNTGRHELSLEADQVEIDVEEIEEVEAEGDKDKSEAGFVGKAEEEENEESEEDSESRETGEEPKKGEKSDSREPQEGDEGVGTGKPEGESVDDEGSRTGKSEGESVDIGGDETSEGESEESSSSSVKISEKDSSDGGGPGVTMRAKKAMLNKIRGGSEEKDKAEESEAQKDEEKGIAEDIGSDLSHVKSKSSGKYSSEEDIDWNPGEDINEVDRNIRELSDLLLDPEVDDDEVYDRIDYQTEVLKDKLKEEPLEERENEEELREDIVDTIDTLNEKIDESEKAKSRIKSFIARLKKILQKIAHLIGIKKVE